MADRLTERIKGDRGLRFFKWHLHRYRGFCVAFRDRNVLTVQHGPVFGAWMLSVGRWSHDSRRIRRWIETGA